MSKEIIEDLIHRVEMLSAEIAIASSDIKKLRQSVNDLQKSSEDRKKRDKIAVRVASLSLCALTIVVSLILVFYFENIIPQSMTHTLGVVNLIAKGITVIGIFGAINTLFGNENNQIIVTLLEKIFR